MNNSPVSFLIFVAALALASYAVYRIGKRSTACGVTLGIGLIVLFVIIAIATAQVTWQVQLTP